MQEKYEVCCALFHGFDWTRWNTGSAQERLGLLPAAQEHVLAQEEGKERCLNAVRELSQAFALAVPHEEALRIRDDVGFFQAVAGSAVQTGGGRSAPRGRVGLGCGVRSSPVLSRPRASWTYSRRRV